MIIKLKEKGKAIQLRKRGFSYSEILRTVPVAKSTLSLWLKSVGLAKKQKQRLTEKKLAALKKGWEACRRKRIFLTERIKKEAEKEVKKLNKRELWLIGVILYWAEGHKERRRGSLVELGNSDANIIRIFLKWLREICKISEKNIRFRIYLHETSKNRLFEVRKYWTRVTGFSINNFQKISWKKHKINTKRKNIGKNYYGLLRVTVNRSTNLNRRIQGWIIGICKHCGVV